MGDEAIVNPRKFSLEGRRIRKVRQSCNRLKKAGFKVRVLYLPDITDGLRKQLDRITSEWLGGKGERGFSMQIDDIWAADRDDCVFAIAIDRDGIARGFAHFVPTALGRGLSLSTQRRRKNTPNGLQEFIFSELFAWAETKGYEEVSLNFSAMGEVLRSKKSDLSASQKLLRWIVIRADRFFQIQRLYRFNRKFLPEWRPRLIAYERYGDLPLGILVIMASESLIGTPKVLGKLNRSTAQ